MNRMIVVINLDSATERRQRMAAQLDALGLRWARMAYDGRRKPAAEITTFVHQRFPALEFDLDTLSGAEVGCWLSHLMAWHRLVTSTGFSACTVLEDDLALDAGLPAAIGTLTAQQAFDLVYLGTSSRNISTRQRVQIGCCTVHVPVGTILNTWGYVIRREFAARFLATRRRIRLPIDRLVGAGNARAVARVGVLQPAVVREDPALGLRSQIEPYTWRADRWKVVEAARRRVLASRVSDLYYALYRWL